MTFLKGERKMKGISRTAVVVKPSGGEVFEEAIFIVREDYLRSRENGREELLREAERAAEAYAASAAGGERHQSCICRTISRLRRTMMRFSSRLM